MILTNLCEIKIAGKNIRHYEKLGYNVKYGDIITVPIKDLTTSSSAILDIMCFSCKNIKKAKYFLYKECTENFSSEYYCKNCSFLKRKKTNMEKYGVENVSQLESVKKIKKDKSIEKFGTVTPLLNKDIINDIKTNYLEKYGVDNISKVDFIKEKKKHTTFKNWGVENPTQSPYIFNIMQKNSKKIHRYKETELYYRGKYELDFLEFCESKNIIVENGLSIDYIYNDQNKKYHSDFYFEKLNIVIEIKSSYYYELYKEKNIAKHVYTEKLGYKHIFIINKNYYDFLEIISKFL